jgi:hypothetical protein
MVRGIQGIALTAMALGIIASSAAADVITNSPSLPPVTDASGNPVAYMTPAQVHATYSGPALTAVLSQVQHSGFSNIHTITQGNNEIDNFQSTLTGQASINGGSSVPFTLSGPVSVEDIGKAGQTTGTFSTQMLSMDMTGTVGGHSVEIMLDPSHPTTGQTSITSIGGGEYHISSFFDVFTELSLDHGAFIPQSDGPTHVSAAAVPEPSPLALAGAAAVCAGALTALRRRLTTRA